MLKLLIKLRKIKNEHKRSSFILASSVNTCSHKAKNISMFVGINQIIFHQNIVSANLCIFGIRH